MNRQQLAFFLTGFGIFIFGCEDGLSSGSSVSAASDLTPNDEFLMSQALAKLPPKVANSVRDALDAAPGPKSQHAILQLFASPKMIDLAKAADDLACTQSGADAVIAIADWAKSFLSHGTDRAAVDQQEATYLDEMRGMLATIDVTDIDGALEALSCPTGPDGGKCDSPLFEPPGCDSTTYNTYNIDCTTTSCALNDVPSIIEQDRAEAAETKLASIFRELDRVRPSNATLGEWNVLRDRYRAGLSAAARSTLQQARRSGSATLARDAQAARRFDEGTRMIDAFVRGKVAFNVDAMNLVHTAVATQDQGRIRTAGQEAFHGRGSNRRYLPGAAVARATASVFSAVHERRANGEAAPLVAAMFDQRMISIHPYMDANGRTTRLMTDWLLAREGFPPALATHAAPSSVLLWESPRITRDAHIEHITEGMRRTVELIEAVG